MTQKADALDMKPSLNVKVSAIILNKNLESISHKSTV